MKCFACGIAYGNDKITALQMTTEYSEYGQGNIIIMPSPESISRCENLTNLMQDT